MTFIGVFYIQSKQKLSLRSRATIQDSFSYGETRSLRKFVHSIFSQLFQLRVWELYSSVFVLFHNLAGARSFQFHFLAISAFCNAGFDNLGSTSLFAFQTDLLVNLVIAGLIITGGFGFMVWFDLAGHVGRKKKGACTFIRSLYYY